LGWLAAATGCSMVEGALPAAGPPRRGWRRVGRVFYAPRLARVSRLGVALRGWRLVTALLGWAVVSAWPGRLCLVPGVLGCFSVWVPGVRVPGAHPRCVCWWVWGGCRSALGVRRVARGGLAGRGARARVGLCAAEGGRWRVGGVGVCPAAASLL
jgi:hypothetical protein